MAARTFTVLYTKSLTQKRKRYNDGQLVLSPSGYAKLLDDAGSEVAEVKLTAGEQLAIRADKNDLAVFEGLLVSVCDELPENAPVHNAPATDQRFAHRQDAPHQCNRPGPAPAAGKLPAKHAPRTHTYAPALPTAANTYALHGPPQASPGRQPCLPHPAPAAQPAPAGVLASRPDRPSMPPPAAPVPHGPLTHTIAASPAYTGAHVTPVPVSSDSAVRALPVDTAARSAAAASHASSSLHPLPWAPAPAGDHATHALRTTAPHTTLVPPQPGGAPKGAQTIQPARAAPACSSMRGPPPDAPAVRSDAEVLRFLQDVVNKRLLACGGR